MASHHCGPPFDDARTAAWSARSGITDGFEAVEYLFPYAYDVAELRRRLDDHGLEQVLFNAPPGAWESGERGMAALPGREAEVRSGVDRTLEYTAALGCPRVHLMPGLVRPDAPPVERAKHHDTYLTNLAWAAERRWDRAATARSRPCCSASGSSRAPQVGERRASSTRPGR
ncbi:TIM barrel protein [Streptomyces sp. NPDC002491]